MGSRINLRLNEKSDKDIIDAISNVKDVTKEIKKLIRLGMSCSGVVVRQPTAPKIETGKVLRPTTQANTTKVNISDVSSLEANLLANFGFDDGDD